jgi:hypothetical protein
MTLEVFAQGVRASVADVLFVIVLGLLTFAPVIAVAYPIWLVFRSRNVFGILPIAAAASCIAVIYCVALVAAGLGAPSDRTMSFQENIQRPFQLLRCAGAALAGALSGLVFRSIAVRSRAH